MPHIEDIVKKRQIVILGISDSRTKRSVSNQFDKNCVCFIYVELNMILLVLAFSTRYTFQLHINFRLFFITSKLTK